MKNAIYMGILTEALGEFKKGWPLLVSLLVACFLTLVYCTGPDTFAVITSIPAL